MFRIQIVFGVTRDGHHTVAVLRKIQLQIMPRMQCQAGNTRGSPSITPGLQSYSQCSPGSVMEVTLDCGLEYIGLLGHRCQIEE